MALEAFFLRLNLANFWNSNCITTPFSCQGKSETLGVYIVVDETGYCYPVGESPT